MTDLSVTDPAPVESDAEQEVTAETPPEEAVEAQEADETTETPAEGQEEAGEEPAEQPETEEFEEVDIDGVKHRIPAALKSAFMKSVDYTQKTQELAANRRELEASQTAMTEQARFQQENITDYGQLAVVNQRLEQFRTLDWAGLQVQEPEQYTTLRDEFTVLRDIADQTNTRIRDREQQAGLKAKDEHTRRLQESDAVLTRDVPGWGTEMANNVRDFAKTNGVTDQQLVQVATNPTFVKLLHQAFVGSQLVETSRAATKKKPPEAKVVPKVKPQGSVPKGPNDKQGIGNWMVERNKQAANSKE